MREKAAATAIVAALSLFAGQASAGQDEAWAAYQAHDYETAAAEFRPLAEAGDRRSQYMLGQLYRQGWGVAQDDAEALQWYLLAARQGSADAFSGLGEMYELGAGVEQDLVRAWAHYTQALQSRRFPSDVEAQMRVGQALSFDDKFAAQDLSRSWSDDPALIE